MLKTIAEQIRKGPKGSIRHWKARHLDKKHLALLEKECSGPSEFDEILSKQTLFKQYKEGKLQPFVVEHSITKDIVVALFSYPEQVKDVPWALWSQIVQLFERPTKQPHTIFLLAHPAVRFFPPYGKPVSPLHINGGYTYPCRPDCVFVFRAEDATRVLIHELFHSGCCDNTELNLEEREAETEAWAELFWCGLLSGGDLKTLKSLVLNQGSLIRSQNRRLLEGRHMQPGHQGFPWRYTIGKELLWAKWNLLINTTDQMQTDSLRLTLPVSPSVKTLFRVGPTSTML